MINEIVNLREQPENGFMPTLTTYVLDDPLATDKVTETTRKFPAVLICPGGGYAYCSAREAEPIAMQFVAAGVHAFVLDYSVAPFRYPRALTEASDALALIRRNSDKWHVDPDKIAVCGFSAGGHLAASLAVFWNKEPIKTEDGINKPNALILGYPVITNGKFAHAGSLDNLCGDDDLLKEKMSLEKQVTSDVPPTFLWHTSTDTCVPVENSLLFAAALHHEEIPFEMHVYTEGQHGLSTSTDYTCEGFTQKRCPRIPGWVTEANAFLKEL